MAKSKNWIHANKIKAFRAKNLSLGQLSIFFTTDARRVFTKLRQVFMEALILNYFDLKRHIQIEMDFLGYAISEIFNQLILNDLSQ